MFNQNGFMTDLMAKPEDHVLTARPHLSKQHTQKMELLYVSSSKNEAERSFRRSLKHGYLVLVVIFRLYFYSPLLMVFQHSHISRIFISFQISQDRGRDKKEEGL